MKIFSSNGCIDADFTELEAIHQSRCVTYRREGKSLFRDAEIITPNRTLRSKPVGRQSTFDVVLEPYLKDTEDIRAFLGLVRYALVAHRL
jgi:hypothetical protein